MAEDVEEKRTLATEVNLEELMEVVTSYKCRFCDFTCSGVPEMSEHLQKTHVVGNTVKPPPPEPEVAVEDPEGELKSNNTSEPELACEEEDENQSESQGSDEVPALLSNLGLAPIGGPGSPSLVGQPSLPDPKVLTNQVRSVAKNLSIMASSPQDLSLFSLTSSAGTQSLPITSLQLTGPLMTTSTTMDTISVLDTTKDLGTGPASIAPITRELFLCGVCSMGFISVDECKYHMEKEHNAPVETASVSDTVVDKYEQRVSVGTQATGKRPGRKRKSEMPPPVSSPPARKLKEEEEDNDEDWLPGRGLSSGTRDGKQRRKIRTPKALKEDYVIEKKRKYRKRRMVIKESYTLSCSYLGCSTKFRCQESLDIHLDCHNKEDDAFTCPHCFNIFDVWKPLRIHLWRSHNVDCDMFQCDLCEYKTDTLHKLGVHREIHSDNRPYTCDVCGKGFKQLSQMKNHQIIHAEHQRSGPDSWFSNKTCDVCKRSFANSKCLKKHVEAVHGQNKPFKCQYCGHTTAWKAMLILHERTHTGEKPFKCDVCPYATGDHNSLRRHKMRHTGQRQYKCQLCAYTCIQTISLKTHMRNKHPNAQGVVYMCQLCKFRTINKQIYDNHMEDHRNGLIPEAKDAVSLAQQPTLAAASQQPALAAAVPALQSALPADQVVGTTAPAPEGSVLYQLQVKKMYTGELHANKEDIDKLNTIYEVVHCGMDANQLIYSALHIGSQNQIGGLTYSAQLATGIQCTVSPTVPPGKAVMTSYLITFCALSGSESQPETSDQSTMVYQTLTEQGVSMVEAANQDESSQPSSQEVEQEGEAVMSLAEVSQAQNGGQVSHILYTQVPQVIDTNATIEEDQTFHGQPNPDFQVMQVAEENIAPADKGVNSGDKAGDRRVVVSEAGHIVEGMEGVLLTEGGQSIVVMEGGQVVKGMLVMAAHDGNQAEVNATVVEDEGQQSDVGGVGDGTVVEELDEERGDADSVSNGTSRAEMVYQKDRDGYSAVQVTLLQETDDVASEEQS